MAELIEDNEELSSDELKDREIANLKERLVNMESFKRLFFETKKALNEEQRQSKKLQEKIDSGLSYAPNDEDGDQKARLQQRIEQLENELFHTSNMAMLSMTTIGEYSALIEFFKNSGTYTELAGFAKSIIAVNSSYNLNTALQIRHKGKTYNILGNGCNENDKKLLKSLVDNERLYEENTLLCINHDGISMLINNLPIDDPDKCGRLRDYIAILAQGAAAILEHIK